MPLQTCNYQAAHSCLWQAVRKTLVAATAMGVMRGTSEQDLWEHHKEITVPHVPLLHSIPGQDCCIWRSGPRERKQGRTHCQHGLGRAGLQQAVQRGAA